MAQTLADVNARSFETTWDRYTLRVSWAVGRYGRVGQKVHLVEVRRVTAERGEHRPGTFKVGDIFSCSPLCNSRRGQHGGQPFLNGRWDLKDVTCYHCMPGRAPHQCTRCEERLAPERTVWLELDNSTNLYHPEGVVEPSRSQGMFPFGRDCAEAERQKTASRPPA